MKAFIFGAGAKGRTLLPAIKQQYDVIGFVDNDETKWGTTTEENLPVHNPKVLLETDFDMVVIGTCVGLQQIKDQLLEMGIKREKIDRSYVSLTIESRIVFLEKTAQLFRENNVQGSVAEGGVFQGEFAKEINRVFPEKTFYLFDTFTGFDERDVNIEQTEQFSQSKAGHFNITSEELVLSKLPHPEKCVIRKGYFPETTAGMDENEKFCFVNLDFDLYQPILSGLEFFVPCMVKGGIILIDDYFAEGYKGAKAAVDAFPNLQLFPIGDGNSIGVMC